MYKTSSCLALLAMVSFNTSASAMPPKPAACPSVANIKSAGLSYAFSSTKWYIVAQLSQYNTNDTWFFGFPFIKAKSTEEALSIGHQWLGTLFGVPQPMPLPSENVWTCLYETSQGEYGVAITPVPTNKSAQLNRALMAAVR